MPYQIAIEINSSFIAQGVQSAEQAIKQLGTASGQSNQKIAQDTEQAAGRANAAFQGMGANLRQLAGAFGVVAGVAGAIGFARSVINLGDTLSDLSEQTGISVRTLAGLRVVAQQSGTSIEAVATGVRFMMRSLAESADQTGTQAAALQRLGLTSAQVLRSMSDPEGFLEKFSQGLGRIPTQAERMALAMEIAGRGAGQLTPVLLSIAQNGLPRVSEETARAYELLGRLADQTVAVTARFVDWVARGILVAKQNLEHLGDAMGTVAARQRALAAAAATGGLQGALPPKPETSLPIDPALLAKQNEAIAALQTQIQKLRVDGLEFARSQGDVGVDVRGATVAMIKQEQAAQILAATNGKILTPGLRALIEQLAGLKLAGFDDQETARSQQQAAAIEKIIDVTQNEITALTSGAAAVEHLKIEQDKLSLSQQFGAEVAAKITAARHDDLNVLLATRQAIDDVRVAGEALERQQQEDAALNSSALAKQLDARQKLADFELQKLGAAGASEAQIAQRKLQLLQEEYNRLASKAVISPEENQRMMDLPHQIEIAQIGLIKLKNTGIDVAGEIGRVVTDITTAVINGTLKWADIGKSILASFVRLAMEQFTNFLRTMQQNAQAASNMAAAGGASTQSGGGGGMGGGGILDMIMGLFKGGGATTTTSNGGGMGGGGILDTIMGLFKGGGSTSSSGGGLGGLFGGGGGGGGMLDSIMGMFGGGGGSTAGGAAGAGWSSGFDAWDAGGFGGATSGGGGMMGGMAGGALAGVMSLFTAAFTGGFEKGRLGSTIGGTIGAVAGSYFGPIGSMIGYMLGSLLGGLFDSVAIPTSMIKIKTAFTGLNPTPFGFQVGEAVSKVLKASNVPKAFQEGIRSQTETIAEETVGAIGDILNIMPKAVQRAIEPLVSQSNAAVDAMLDFKISAPITEFAAKIKKFMSNLSYRILAAYGDPLIEALRLQLERTGLPFPTFAPSEQFVSTKTKKGDVAIGTPTDLPSEFIDNMFHYLQGFKQKQRAEKLPDVMDAIQKVFEVANNLEAVSRIMTLEQKQNIAAGFTNVLQAGSPKEVEVDLARFQRQFGPTLKFLEEAQQQSADLFGRGIIAALEAASESEAKLKFLKNLGDGAQQMLFEGIANAFVQAAQFQDFLAPMQQIIHKFVEDAMETGLPPDIAAFRTALLPLVEDFSTRAELLAPLIAELQKLGFDLKDILKGLTLGGANIVININGNVNNEQDARTLADLIFNHLDNSLPPPA